MLRIALFCLALVLTPFPASAGAPIPIGWYEFCKQHAEECVRSKQTSLRYTKALWRSLASVNDAVNAKIVPKPDEIEVWSIEPEAGDCDDYVMTKRHRLIQMGYPQSALRLAHVVTRQGEGHLVLVVQTDKGKLVLDNLVPDIRYIEQMQHTIVKISTADPRIWQSVRPLPRTRQ